MLWNEKNDCFSAAIWYWVEIWEPKIYNILPLNKAALLLFSF